MRAFALTTFDSGPELVELDLPEPVEGEVRVQVHTAAVNGFDLAVAGGLLKDMMEHRFPVVLGKDFAGVVDALGYGVTDYEVGGPRLRGGNQALPGRRIVCRLRHRRDRGRSREAA